MKLTSKLLTFGFTAIGAAMFFSGKASAATITVNAFTDDITVNGNCTLREAVQAANMNTAVDACISGEEDLDTIVLSNGTYNLTIPASAGLMNEAGDLDVFAYYNDGTTTINSGDVEIVGAGAGNTIINGNGVTKVFDFRGFLTNNSIRLSGLDITNGGTSDLTEESSEGSSPFGGAFACDDENLTVTTNGVRIYGNSGEDIIFGYCNLNLVSTQIYSNTSTDTILEMGSNLSLTSVVIRDNTSDSEVIVVDGGSLELNQSYVGENTVTSATRDIYLRDSTVDIENSTLYSSDLDNNVIYMNGALGGTISSSTIKGASTTQSPINFSNVTTGNITLQNTIVDGPTAVSCALATGRIVSGNNNISSGTCDTLTESNDQEGVDPELEATPTLIAGTYVFVPTSTTSPIVDTGASPATVSVDQTGATRPQDGNPGGDNFMDIGAYELPVEDTSAPVIIEVTPVPSSSMDSTPSYTFSASEAGTLLLAGPCSLPSASVVMGSNTVTFNSLPAGTYNCSIQMEDFAGNPSNILNLTFTITALPTSTPLPTATALPTSTSATSTPVTGTGTTTGTVTPSGAVLPDTGNSSVLGLVAGSFIVLSAGSVLVIYKRRLHKK